MNIIQKNTILFALGITFILSGCAQEGGNQENSAASETPSAVSQPQTTPSPAIITPEPPAVSQPPTSLETPDPVTETKWERLRPVPDLPLTGSSLDDFIPEGWALRDSVASDFNQDGYSDYVAVLDHIGDWEEPVQYDLSPRILFAVFGDERGTYSLNFQDINLIRAKSEGGVLGDPYLPMTAEGASFTTHAFGGSAWLWSEAYTYTYENGDWYLTYSEDTYGYRAYTTIDTQNDYQRGVGTQSLRLDSLEKINEYFDNPDSTEPPFDLTYEYLLDAPLNLYQASMRWWLSPERIADWQVDDVEIADGLVIHGEVVLPSCGIAFRDCDEQQLIYSFAAEDADYLAVYRFLENKLCVIAALDGQLEDAIIYQGKLYLVEDVNRTIRYWRTKADGTREMQSDECKIGSQLYRMNMDGSEKELIFELYLSPSGTVSINPPDAGQSDDKDVWEQYPYFSLYIVQTGGSQLIINGGSHYYCIDTDGSNIRLLGAMPE